MRPALDLLRSERRARWFLAAYAQSSIGTGAAYVALVLLAYDRLGSPWAISLVLLADFLPAVLLGPLLGAAADRWPRRACMVTADLVRAAAFAGIAFAPSFELTLALALVAGTGTALFKPAALASLPGLVDRERLPAVTSLYGAVGELGFTGGPALAAAVTLFASPEAMLAGNAATFLASAVVLAFIPTKAAAAAEGGSAPGSLLADTREGIRALMRLRDVRALVFVSAGLVAVVSLVNVAEMLLATEAFKAGDSGYSILVTASGVGLIAGALVAGRAGRPSLMRRGFVAAILIEGVLFALAGVTPFFILAVACFAVAGVCNGAEVAYSRMLIQTTVRDDLLGRVFGVENALISMAFVVAFLVGGAVVSAAGPRAVMFAAGTATVLVGTVAAIALRDAWRDREAAAPLATPAPEPAGG